MHRALPDPVVGSARRRGALCVAAVIGVVSVLAVGLVGCSSSASPTASDGPPGTVSHAASNAVVSDDTPRPGGKIVYALSAESNGWNPATNEWGPQG